MSKTLSADVLDMTLYFKDGDYKNHILNEKNINITDVFIESIFKKYGLKHKVKNIDVFQLAMVHKSYLDNVVITEKIVKLLKDVIPIEKKYVKKTIPLQPNDNGRLEFLGDAIIHCAIARYIFDRFGSEPEGFLTKLRIELEKNETLSILSKKLGLEKYAIISRSIEYTNGRKNNISISEDIFEGFIGALSLECDYEKCKDFIISIIETEIDIVDLISNDTNYKHRLMQYYHKMKWGEPKYCEDLSKLDAKTYKTYILSPKGTVLGSGEGNSKQKSEKIAAHKALIKLGVIKDEDDTSDYYDE